MKCPRCDTDITAKKKCNTCGLNVAASGGEIEVEYKDFKTSEFLEIRQKRQTGPSGEETKTVREQPRGKAIKSKDPAKPSPDNDKSPFPILAAVVLFLMLITGVFFLVRYLVLP